MLQSGPLHDEQCLILDLPVELKINIFSYLGLVELGRVNSTSKHLSNIVTNGTLWSPLLKNAALDPMKNVMEAINNHAYTALSPNCLLELLSLGRINLQDFTPPILALLKAHNNDLVSQTLQTLISPEMRQMYKSGNMTPKDFASLDLEQLWAMIPLRYTAEIFRQADITPKDFTALTPRQIKAISLWSCFATELFIECGVKPQDFVELSPAQIETIAVNQGCKQLFVACRFKPQDLVSLSPDQIETIIRWPNSGKVLLQNHLTAKFISELSTNDIELLFFTGDPRALQYPISSSSPTSGTLASYLSTALESLTITHTSDISVEEESIYLGETIMTLP